MIGWAQSLDLGERHGMTSTTASPSTERGGVRVAVQKFGTAMSNMIMPNIPALIAWGFLTALFIPDGWTPHAGLSGIVGPAIHYLLPILVAGQGGRMIYGDRGAVVSAFAVMGAIAGSDFLISTVNDTALVEWLAGGNAEEDFKALGQVHMFIGAMILGPLSAWVMKKLDALWEGKIRAGFEMLVNMFSAGFVAFGMAVVGYFAVAPVVNKVMDVVGGWVEGLVNAGLLPLTSILIEPAKVFFLNNAINHGALTPLGLAEADRDGKSVLFLLESNPGPGLGLLLAIAFFGSGIARATAPGAAIIQVLGGIHEIYFPYALATPKLILALIAGGMSGVFVNVLFDTGLRAPASPGSIIAIMLQTASDSYLGVILSVVVSTAVTFVLAALLLRTGKDKDAEIDLAASTSKMEGMKGKASIASSLLTSTSTGPINSIVFACDAGMGSSAMGASVLRKKVQAAGFTGVTVVNKAISNLTDTYDLVVTHQDLTERAQQRTGSAMHVSVDNFMASPRYDEIVELLQQRNGSGIQDAPVTAPAAVATATRTSVLAPSSVVLTGVATTRQGAIEEAGNLLVVAGAATTAYVAAMHEREASVSTFMGEGLAIPHGTNEAKGEVSRTAVSFVRYPQGIDWGGEQVKFVIAIAASGDEHLALLQQVAGAFLDDASVARLEAASTVDEVKSILDA